MASRAKGRIFISYAKEDVQLAASLYFNLKRHGLDPWMDQYDIRPGERWEGAIRRAVQESSNILALLSSRSVNKKGYVQKELRLALEEFDKIPEGEIFLIPVRLDECEPSHERLKELQYVDLFPSYDAGLEGILRVLQPTAGPIRAMPRIQRRARILVVDDDEGWRRRIVRFLEKEGLIVRSASGLAEAKELLLDDFFHFAIIDLRLEDESSVSEDGMLLLREIKEAGLQDAILVVVLSAYATVEQMRQAFLDFGVADFLSKQHFEGQEFVRLVRFLGERARINLNLTLHWHGIEEHENFVSAVRSEWTGERPAWQRISEELDDLLCRLFHEADRVLVRAVPRRRGGQVLLHAQPVYANGVGRTVIVKIGEAAAIERERQNFESHVQPFLGGSFVASPSGSRRTPILGGLAYLPGSEAGEKFEDFGSFYQRSAGEEILRILDLLFLEALVPWYAQVGSLKTVDFSSAYPLPLLALEHGFREWAGEGVELAAAGQELSFLDLPGYRVRNPLGVAARGVARPTYLSITHGSLGERSSILLDERSKPWLINFGRTGQGHLLRDLVDLDVAIRISWLDPEGVGLQERLELEEHLAKPSTFEELRALPSLARGHREVEKAFQVCKHLRSLAAKLLAMNPAADLGEVQLGLLYAALGLRGFSADLAVVQRQHALASAGILAARLKL